MSIRIKRGQLSAVAKTSADGTFGSPTHIGECYDFAYTYEREAQERNPGSQYVGPVEDVPTSRRASATFRLEVRGSGTAGTAPNIAPILKAAGHIETVVSSTSVTYEPSDTPATYASGGPALIDLQYIEDGNRYRIMDAAVTAFALSAGGQNEVVFATVTVEGVHVAEAGGASFVSDVVVATAPPPFTSITATLGGTAFACPTSFTFDGGVQGSVIPCATSATGYKAGVISDFAPLLTISYRGQAFGTENPYTALATTDTPAVVLAWGATAGNIITLNVANAQRISTSPGDADGFRTFEAAFKAINARNGDPLYTIVFT